MTRDDVLLSLFPVTNMDISALRKIAGPTVFAGYLTSVGEPLDTSSFDEDGHFRTGDVVGVPDDVMGERVCAVVVPGARKPSLEELVAYLREKNVAAFKLPERLEYADALPRNPVGKILKRQLRESLE
jgi:non-ribosomal peptide synthetase component E (peptide arylation enzyme)